VGSISTAAQAGAAFRFRLVWSLAVATICLVFLIEMSGRLAAVSRHTLADAVRERFGLSFHAVPLIAEAVLDVLVLAAELGGASIALYLLTGVSVRVWVLVAALAVWLLLSRGDSGRLRNVMGLGQPHPLSFAVRRR